MCWKAIASLLLSMSNEFRYKKRAKYNATNNNTNAEDDGYQIGTQVEQSASLGHVDKCGCVTSCVFNTECRRKEPPLAAGKTQQLHSNKCGRQLDKTNYVRVCALSLAVDN